MTFPIKLVEVVIFSACVILGMAAFKSKFVTENQSKQANFPQLTLKRNLLPPGCLILLEA